MSAHIALFAASFYSPFLGYSTDDGDGDGREEYIAAKALLELHRDHSRDCLEVVKKGP